MDEVLLFLARSDKDVWRQISELWANFSDLLNPGPLLWEVIYNFVMLSSTTLVAGNTWDLSEANAPGSRDCPCNLTGILLGFRGLFHFQYSEGCVGITLDWLNHAQCGRIGGGIKSSGLWSISDVCDLFSSRGTVDAMFYFLTRLRPEAHVLFCPVASWFSNTSPLELKLPKEWEQFRSTDNCFQMHIPCRLLLPDMLATSPAPGLHKPTLCSNLPGAYPS